MTCVREKSRFRVYSSFILYRKVRWEDLLGSKKVYTQTRGLMLFETTSAYRRLGKLVYLFIRLYKNGKLACFVASYVPVEHVCLRPRLVESKIGSALVYYCSCSSQAPTTKVVIRFTTETGTSIPSFFLVHDGRLHCPYFLAMRSIKIAMCCAMTCAIC
jgi:hypothetical protein